MDRIQGLFYYFRTHKLVDSRLKKDTRAEKVAIVKKFGKRKSKRMQRKRKSRN